MSNASPIDIQHMPGFNPEVRNGIDSVSRGLVIVEHHPRWTYNVPGIGVRSFGKPYPRCTKHGAMLRVSKGGIWRCGELGCDTGCYLP